MYSPMHQNTKETITNSSGKSVLPDNRNWLLNITAWNQALVHCVWPSRVRSIAKAAANCYEIFLPLFRKTKSQCCENHTYRSDDCASNTGYVASAEASWPWSRVWGARCCTLRGRNRCSCRDQRFCCDCSRLLRIRASRPR